MWIKMHAVIMMGIVAARREDTVYYFCRYLQNYEVFFQDSRVGSTMKDITYVVWWTLLSSLSFLKHAVPYQSFWKFEV